MWLKFLNCKAGKRMQIILLKKPYFGKHFLDIINENIIGALKWYLICSSLYQNLPKKLDSLEKIQTWYYGGKIKSNPFLSVTYLSLPQTKGPLKY